MKLLVLFLVSLASLFAAATIKHNNTHLGEPRVYTSYKGEKKLELTLIRLAKRSDKMVLISFNVPGHPLHKQSFIYDEKCETTKCNKIFFTQHGGKMINLIADNGYWGHGLQALLPGEKGRIPLYYDEDLSTNKSTSSLFNEYLSSIYRDIRLSEAELLLKQSAEFFNQECGASADLKINIDHFKNKVQTRILGMGKPMLDEISKTCSDTMYKEIFSIVKKVSFEPSTHKKEMVLTKMNELIIYLSPDLYNPSVTAKQDINQL